MKILHTGDCHMNHRLGRIDVTTRIQDALRQVAAYLEEHQVDVLVIAGDLWCGRESREQLNRSMRFLKECFRPFLERPEHPGTIVAISGNHDSESFLETLRDAFDLVSPIRKNAEGIHPAGRLYLAPNPRVLTLTGRDGLPVQFVLMPYPTPRCYLIGDDVRYRSVDERNAAMAQAFRETLEELKQRVEPRFPTILVSHAQVRGVPVSDLFRRGDEHEVIVEIPDLPTHFAYGAYGHIHRQGPIGAAESHFWYCGSLLPLDAGETEQQKGVLLADIGPGGLREGPRPLEIRGPKLLDLTGEKAITPEQIASLRDRYPDGETALVKYCLRYNPAECPDPFPLHQQIRQIFPCWYESDAESVHLLGEDGEGEDSRQPFRDQLDDIRATTLNYLGHVATWDGSPTSKAEVVGLVEKLFADDSFMACIQEGR